MRSSHTEYAGSLQLRSHATFFLISSGHRFHHANIVQATSHLPMHSTTSLRLKNEASDQAPYCRIGKQPVSTPLVTLPQVRAHLSLLRAIQELRSTVEEGTDERFPEYVKTLQPPQRWIWMIGLAIDRFLKWLQTIERTDLSAWVEDQLPPLDVLMVWHTYMLNPHWYAEDCDRLPVLRGLKSVDDYLIRSLVAVGDIGAYEPSDAHRQAWRDTCGTSWDPLNAAGDGTLEYRGVVCPKCLITQSVPNVDDEGHGYMQNDFALECTNCGGLITKEGLAVHKLVRDLVRDYRVDSELQKYGLGVYLPGTLRTPKRAADIANASSVKKRLWSLKICSDSLAAVQAIVTQPQPPEEITFVWERTLMLELEYSMNEMRRQIQHNLSTKEAKMMNNVLSAYTSDRPFSVELVGAVLRQGSFIEKMHQLGWTVQDRFSTEEDSIVLEHSIARYHAFLDLLSTSSSTLFVPTLDIDLVWHTHQLLGQRYADNCLKYFGRYIDHDDKVEEARLANSFDETCRAWQRQFGVPYMHCGCPAPIPETGIRRLSSVVTRFRSRSTSGSTLDLMPPEHSDALSATHASEHNAFLFATNSRGFDSQARLARLEKLKLWQEHEERSAKKDASSLRPDSRTSHKRSQVDHDPAFLAAPPFWAFAGAPLGVCTAVTSGGRGSASD